MITVRPSHARGRANFGWLNTCHTFSFGNYYHPEHMGFASLRVINEDQIKPSQGFNTHRHQDMEIITYVLAGSLAHQDNIGNGFIIRPGDVQRMSAGTGIAHSEFNASDRESVHLLQIWITPNQTGIQPSYEQKHFAPAMQQGGLTLVASPDGRNDSVTIHQDAYLYAAQLNQDAVIHHTINGDRAVWLQIVRGSGEIQGQPLQAGDGVAITQESQLDFVTKGDKTEILLFDLT